MKKMMLEENKDIELKERQLSDNEEEDYDNKSEISDSDKKVKINEEEINLKNEDDNKKKIVEFLTDNIILKVEDKENLQRIKEGISNAFNVQSKEYEKWIRKLFIILKDENVIKEDIDITQDMNKILEWYTTQNILNEEDFPLQENSKNATGSGMTKNKELFLKKNNSKKDIDQKLKLLEVLEEYELIPFEIKNNKKYSIDQLNNMENDVDIQQSSIFINLQ
jgi:hypothetical protein